MFCIEPPQYTLSGNSMFCGSSSLVFSLCIVCMRAFSTVSVVGRLRQMDRKESVQRRWVHSREQQRETGAHSTGTKCERRSRKFECIMAAKTLSVNLALLCLSNRLLKYHKGLQPAQRRYQHVGVCHQISEDSLVTVG
ncbi:uncharacterized protein LOC119170689 isoform X2 [Rhipicephalus microplus]|uniref:uncharacterized protein LOC119170689 isoform X2 n=1 Tax=Rhipicephalus microplus TaxID=6941 RepID=UPI003F6D053C